RRPGATGRAAPPAAERTRPAAPAPPPPGARAEDTGPDECPAGRNDSAPCVSRAGAGRDDPTLGAGRRRPRQGAAAQLPGRPAGAHGPAAAARTRPWPGLALGSDSKCVWKGGSPGGWFPLTAPSFISRPRDMKLDAVSRYGKATCAPENRFISLVSPTTPRPHYPSEIALAQV